MTRFALIPLMLIAAALTGCGGDEESKVETPPVATVPEPIAAEPEREWYTEPAVPTKYITIGEPKPAPDPIVDPEPAATSELPPQLEPQLEPEIRAPEVSYKRLANPKPYHYANIKRWDFRIEIPLGRSREDVTATLEKAVRDFRSKQGGHAIEVLAYAPGDDPNGQPTIGKGILAPNGKWADAGERGPMRFRVLSLRDRYFEPADAVDPWKPGTEVTLTDSSERLIRLSSRWDEWGEDREIASVPSGTHATILEKRIEALGGNHELIRYRVKVEVDGRTARGWVDREVVERSGEDGP